MNIVFINGSPNADGATNSVFDIIIKSLGGKHNTQKICLGDYKINYCLGCKKCYEISKCVQNDDVEKIMRVLEKADKIVIGSPSYWADITGQLKVFIDRCTPYCDTHSLHAKFTEGKKGYAIALRTGKSAGECLHIIESINHFYGHLGIEKTANIYFSEIVSKEDIKKHEREIADFVLKKIAE